MSRLWVIWTVLVVCGLLIVGAMGWLTQRTLGMEHERIEAEARAKVEERVRLALSRMDTAASAMLVIENQRPPEHYRPFYQPKMLFTNTLQSVSSSLVTQPSPLLADPPEFVKLHFEVWAHHELTSPQVPTGNRRDLAEASGIEAAEIEAAAKRLQRLRELLSAPLPEVSGQSRRREQDAAATFGDNMERMISVTLPGNTAWNEPPLEDLEQKVEWSNRQLQEIVTNSYARPAEESNYQQELTRADRDKRMQVYAEAQSKASQVAVKKLSINKGAPRGRDQQKLEALKALDQASKEQPLLENPSTSSQWALGEALPSGVAPNPSVADVAVDAAPPTDAAQRAAPAASGSSRSGALKDTAGEPADKKQQLEIVDLDVTPFRPVWIDGELLAVRRVRSETGMRFQGFWIDATALRDSLIGRVSDLLPEARLKPLPVDGATTLEDGFESPLRMPDERSLVTLPWRLEEGIDVDVALAGFTPLHVSLGIGWVAVLLAMVAAAGLVRGVLRMSERRAAFVSSVTHELRTPLTTFQLYSDLLAEGMVRDEDKKQGYLETMRREAGRLNHLIENVLSYSRIERGSARTQREQLQLSSLIERIERRLSDRAEREQARIEVEGLDECREVAIETDVTAVEQIVFNLVDNACKYGLPDEGERVVSVRLSAGRKHARIAVCDSGDGILYRDRKRLFRPFHKSAHDAANSKPGVGLGLALCRRLARALGGDISIDCQRDRGACFVLELPLNRDPGGIRQTAGS